VFNITEERWSGNYALLEIEGCQGCGALKWSDSGKHWQEDGFDAYVAEFAATGEIGNGIPQDPK
jgi:hypothetical protein